MTGPGAISPSRRVAVFGLAVLCLIYTCSFVDRQIMALLVAPIRSELHISDTQFSLLQGFAFSILYAVLGIPIGRWVDRGDRRWILAAGTMAWSAFTALCGAAHGFGMLFLCRIGVGAGEATVVPVTYSLLGDYFSRARRGVAMGAFGVGVYAGMGLAMVLGGSLIRVLEKLDLSAFPLVSHSNSWRLVFVVVGLPGVALAFSTFALFEPRNAVATRKTEIAKWWPHARESLGPILSHHVATAFLAMALYTMILWAPELYRRVYRVPGGVAGMQIGLVILVCGCAGVLAGGAVSDALLRRGVRAARLVTLAGTAVCAFPFALCFPLAASEQTATVLLGAAIFFVAVLTSAGPAGVQDLYPASLRGIGASIYQLSVNLIGLGLGPTAAALISDHVLHNESRLDEALAIAVPLMLLGAAAAGIAGLRSYAAKCSNQA